MDKATKFFYLFIFLSLHFDVRFYMKWATAADFFFNFDVQIYIKWTILQKNQSIQYNEYAQFIII